MTLSLFDSHAHLTSIQMLDDLEEILNRAQQNCVKKIVNIATDQASYEEGVKVQQKYPWVFLAAATPPHDVKQRGEIDFPLFSRAAKEKRLIALGETGLDYYYEPSPKKVQQEFLIRYVELAKQVDLPLLFHCRQAFADLFSITDTYYQGAPAVVHCFTGTFKEAKQALDRGWYLSFSGICTFKKEEYLRDILREIPLTSLLIETDAPYLAPQSQRGKRNEPAFLGEIVATIAKVKQLETVEVAFQIYQNSLTCFRLKESFHKRSYL